VKFQVNITKPDNTRRTAFFESRYDAISILVEQIEEDVLLPGERITLVGSRHESGPPAKRTQVPDIERIA
jgi:hypothetical protein